MTLDLQCRPSAAALQPAEIPCLPNSTVCHKCFALESMKCIQLQTTHTQKNNFKEKITKATHFCSTKKSNQNERRSAEPFFDVHDTHLLGARQGHGRQSRCSRCHATHRERHALGCTQRCMLIGHLVVDATHQVKELS